LPEYPFGDNTRFYEYGIQSQVFFREFLYLHLKNKGRMLFSPLQQVNKNPDIANVSDIELVSLFKETGDNAIVGELFNRYAHLLFGTCMKYMKSESDSKDALMHVFEKLFEYLKVYEINNFKSWIYSVTKHHCLFLLKKHNEYSYEEKDLIWKSPKEFVEFGDDLTLNGRLENKDGTQLLMQAIEKLNEEQKICIELFFLQEKSYQEVQDITRLSYKEVKSHIQNGKRNLRIMLSNSNE
jgi:RNA polymerase sigma factor (sigma-70 family)